MATAHEIEVIITQDGQVKLEVKGMKGPGCMAALKELAEGLGAVLGEERSSAFYEASSQSRSQRLGGS